MVHVPLLSFTSTTRANLLVTALHSASCNGGPMNKLVRCHTFLMPASARARATVRGKNLGATPTTNAQRGGIV